MEMIAAIVEGCIYQEPLPIYKKCVYGATLFFLIGLAFLEVIGKHLQYSKFWNSGSKNSKKSLLSSKIGMLVLYTPALFASISSFWFFPDGGIRFLMLKSAITIHFLKRDLEVLFLHKFSGFMVLESAIIISTTYLTAAASMIYFHHLTHGLPEPSIDLKYLGAALSLVGLSGNFYHHYLLSKLRQKNDKGYKIPQGGLFSLVICPHYLFEIITFVGFSFISQTIYSYLCAVGVALYLLGRSFATRNCIPNLPATTPKNLWFQVEVVGLFYTLQLSLDAFLHSGSYPTVGTDSSSSNLPSPFISSRGYLRYYSFTNSVGLYPYKMQLSSQSPASHLLLPPFT